MADSTREGRAEDAIAGGQLGRGTTNEGGSVSSDQLDVLSGVSSGARDDLICLTGSRSITDRVLAAGWRPPLPDVPTSVADAIEFVLVRFVEGTQSRDVVRSILTEALSASPLPDSETEWGRTFEDGSTERLSGDREYAELRVAQYRGTTLVRRECGPWIEVPRG